jgi:hypothetical protein
MPETSIQCPNARKRSVSTVFLGQLDPVILEEWELRQTQKSW